MPSRDGALSTHVPRSVPKVQNSTGQRSSVPRAPGYREDVAGESSSQRVYVDWWEESSLLHEEGSRLPEEVGG